METIILAAAGILGLYLIFRLVAGIIRIVLTLGILAIGIWIFTHFIR